MVTIAQMQAMKADILADGTLNAQPNTPEGNAVVAALYNATATPDFWVWKSGVSKTDLTNSIGPDGTTFAWTGNGFITRSVGELTAWQEIFDAQGMTNPSLANVRQAFADIFSGAGNAAANRTHLLAVARRRATRLEKLLATGTGSTGSPATMGYEGRIEYWEIEAARLLP